MKKNFYIRPLIREIDLIEESGILVQSEQGGTQETMEVGDGYGDGDALSKKKNIWEKGGIWK